MDFLMAAREDPFRSANFLMAPCTMDAVGGWVGAAFLSAFGFGGALGLATLAGAGALTFGAAAALPRFLGVAGAGGGGVASVATSAISVIGWRELMLVIV